MHYLFVRLQIFVDPLSKWIHLGTFYAFLKQTCPMHEKTGQRLNWTKLEVETFFMLLLAVFEGKSIN